jgi:hypothetical protein
MLGTTQSFTESSNDDEDGDNFNTKQQTDLVHLYKAFAVKEYADALIPSGLIGELLSPRAGKKRF